MAVAEIVLKSNAICVVCGGMASRTQRLGASQAQVEVGANGLYEARCRGCFDPHLEEKLTSQKNSVKRSPWTKRPGKAKAEARKSSAPKKKRGSAHDFRSQSSLR